MSINFLEKIIDKLSLNLPFLNRKNSDNNKSVVQNSNVKYVAGRDINEIKLSNPNIKNLSNVEKKVLKLLYEEYNKSGTNGKKIFNVYKELDIKDASTLIDSQLIKSTELFFKMTTDGIRYMDSLEIKDINNIILPEEQRRRDLVKQQQRIIFERRRSNQHKNSAR